MNAYDFDKTLYPCDSTFRFYRFLLRRHPSLLLELPRQIKAALAYRFKRIEKTQMKEKLFAAFRRIDDIDREVKLFWDKHEGEIEPYYEAIKRPDDVIISASPTFLLEEISKRVGFGTLIASRVDKKSGAYTGENCYGEEKCRRFYEVFPEGEIECFYSDSLSDTPMARLAKQAYLIKDHQPTPWPFPEKSEK